MSAPHFAEPDATRSLLLVLDQFAALRSYGSATPAVGGYRVLPAPRPEPRRLPTIAATVAALARARRRATGFFSALLAGGLGLAVLAGPSSCPCSSAFSTAEAAPHARLGYVHSAMVAGAEMDIDEAELPRLSAATLLEPEETAAAASPITTSALEPWSDAPPIKSDERPRAARLPPLRDELADRRPEPIRLAAATLIQSDAENALTVIEARPVPIPRSTAEKAEREVTPKRTTRARLATRAYRAGKPTSRAATGSGETVKRAPRWAQQMYVTPWQSRAFSYTQ